MIVLIMIHNLVSEYEVWLVKSTITIMPDKQFMFQVCSSLRKIKCKLPLVFTPFYSKKWCNSYKIGCSWICANKFDLNKTSFFCTENFPEDPKLSITDSKSQLILNVKPLVASKVFVDFKILT